MGSTLDDEISYRDLRVVHQTEKKSPSITEINPDFYKKAKEYVEKLEKKMNSEGDEHKRKLVEDELRSAKQILKEIYEIREKKVVLAALSKIRGGKPDTRLFLDNERKLFDDILKCLESYRKIILEGKEKEEAIVQEKKEKRILALVKEDIPRFVGPDMKKYHLRKNDLISLSEELFNILERKGVVERVA